MKIAFLSPFHPFRGGIAQFSNRLYRAFEQLSHEVKAFNFTTQYPDFLFPGKTQYVVGDSSDKVPSVRILSSINPISYWKTAQQIRAFAPDLLLMRYWMPFFAPSLGTVARLLPSSLKKMAILDNLVPHEKRVGDHWLNQYFLSSCHSFLVMSQQVENELRSLRPHAAYVFHPHPIYDHYGQKIEKHQARRLLGIRPDLKWLLFFGLIRPYKGLDLLLEAMQSLDESFGLLIAGESYEDFKTIYQPLIDKLPFPENISANISFVPEDNVLTYFSAADVVVLPYKSATQSGVTAIALHFEVPVIVTDVGGLKEQVAEKLGLVAEPTKEGLLKQIRYFFEKKPDFSSTIRAAKAQLSWQSLAETIIQFNTT
ncbi:MAG: glycosyltransferase [Flammeovirgaceae bacterium]|nr:glycosyltransferase [Flammeovirgaceae bacterium]